MPSSPSRMPPKTPAAATIEPTERSMPAVAMTKVMPIASTPTTLAWVSMLRMLSQVGNVSGLRIAPATNRSDDDDPRARTPGTRARAVERRRSGRPRGRAGHYDLLGQDRGIGGRDGVAEELALGGVLAVDLGDDLALAHDQDARADADQLLELGRDHEHAEAGLGEVADDPVDLGLRRTSTPRVGSSSSRTRHSCSSQRASTTFCWLPPESRRTTRSGSSGRCSAPAAARAPARARALMFSSQRARSGRGRRGSRSSSGSSRAPAPATCGPPGRARARPDRAARAVRGSRSALEEDLALVRRVEPVDEAQQLGAARADQAAEARRTSPARTSRLTPRTAGSRCTSRTSSSTWSVPTGRSG